MKVNGSFGLFALVLMFVFMMLQVFGVLSAPFLVWVIWTLIAAVLIAIGR